MKTPHTFLRTSCFEKFHNRFAEVTDFHQHGTQKPVDIMRGIRKLFKLQSKSNCFTKVPRREV